MRDGERTIPVHLVEHAGGCGCSTHPDLDGYDRARDEQAEDVWARRERESAEQEREERDR